MKVTIELSPVSYIRLSNRCPTSSRLYAVLSNGCIVRQQSGGSCVQIVCELDEAKQLHDFASPIDRQAALEIMTSAGPF